MNIVTNNQCVKPGFGQIRITQMGQKAINAHEWFKFRLNEAVEKTNEKYPNTEFWDLIIDGKEKCEYDRLSLETVFKYISKKTGEVFEYLMAEPNTDTWGGGYYCKTLNDKYLPPEVLLFRSNHLMTGKVKELAFDMKNREDADIIWRRLYDSRESEIDTYITLEELSSKYKSSLNIGVDEFVNQNPKFERKSRELECSDKYIFFADGDDGWFGKSLRNEYGLD